MSLSLLAEHETKIGFRLEWVFIGFSMDLLEKTHSVYMTIDWLTEELAANLAVLTVVCRFAINSSVPFHFLAVLGGTLQRRGTRRQTATDERLHQRQELRPTPAGNPGTIPGQVPRQLDHGNDGVEPVEMVEVMSVDCNLVLEARKWTNIPRHIVTPTLCYSTQ